MDSDRRVAELEDRVAALERLLSVKPADPDSLYTPQEVADRLCCGKTNIYDLMASGMIATVRVGAGQKGLRIRGSDITAFLDSRTAGGPSPKSTYKHLAKYVR